MQKVKLNIIFILFFVILILTTPFLSYGADEMTSLERVKEKYHFPDTAADVIMDRQPSPYAPRELTPSNPEKIELEYRFLEPKIKKIKEYHSIDIKGTYKYWDEPGLPLLPIKTVKILIPQGKDVKNINIVPGRRIILDGEFKIEYSKQQIPISRPELMVETEPNPEIYTSSNPFPGKLYFEVSTQYFRGYKILIVNLFPVEWTPVPGKISYYPDMRAVVTTAPAGHPYVSRSRCRNLPGDISRLRRLIDNPSIVNSYVEETAGAGEIGTTAETTGVAPLSLTGGPHEYVIITTEALKSAFQTLADYKISKNITATVVTVDHPTDGIYVNYEGTRPDGGTDNQTKIRNFIIDAYNTWGTQYILLGGDGDGDGGAIIPHRGVYGEVATAPVTKDEDIPCDMYYGALDYDWDTNKNGIYGDYGKIKNKLVYDEVDLLAEVYVGRIACDTATEAANQINKIIAYEDSTPSKNTLLVGEQLDTYPTYGGDYKDEVYTYFPGQWSRQMLYERDATFSKDAVVSAMNSNQNHIVNHMGHAINDYNMGLYNNDVDTLLTNTTYFLAYSQGCYSNAFDNRTTTVGSYTDDAISEHFTAENNTAAFAYIGNTRYGWYVQGSTNGASQKFDIEFFDAIFNEEDKTNLGIALEDSKQDLIGLVGPTGAIRWCYFQLCLMGDPQTPFIWTKPDLTLTGSTDISFSNPAPEVGELITISATIHNNAADYKDLFASYAETGDVNIIIDESEWVAQPFEVTSTLSLDKVSLYIFDSGTDDSMTVEIRKDDGTGTKPGTGAENLLASQTVNTGDSYAWVDFVFDSPSTLSPGTYWICGENSAADIGSGTNGYIWKMDQGVGSITVSFDLGVSWATGYSYTTYFEAYRSTEVNFYDGDPDVDGTLIGTDYLSPISASGTDTASVEWTAVSGTHDIWVVVDPEDSIPESDETNNKDYKTITVGAAVLSVLVSPDYWNIGAVESGSVNTMKSTANTPLVVQNDGTETETFTLQVTNTGGIWSAATTEDGNANNTFVMSGVFTSIYDTIGKDDFNQGSSDDVIISANLKAATSETFGCTNSTANGVGVPKTEGRYLWLQFKAPSTTSTFEQQGIVVTVGAQAD